MRDYIFSLTLLAIFLGGYTALVVQFAKPIESNRSAASVMREQALETSATPRQVAEPTSEE